MKRTFFARYKKRKPIFKKKIFWLFIFCFLLIYFCFFLVFEYSLFKIKKVEILGLQRQKILKLEILKRTLNKNLLIFSVPKLEKEIKNEFLSIKEIKISKKIPDKLIVELKEREIFAQYCAKDCFWVDKEGMIFEKTKESNLIKIGSKEIKNLGEKITDSQKMSKIASILDNLKNMEIGVVQIYFLNSTEIDFKTQDGFSIFFDLEKDSNWQIEKLKIAFEKEITKEKRKNLQYIDLRFGDFVNYKFK